MRHPGLTDEQSTTLNAAIVKVRIIEESVDRALRSGSTPRGANNFNRDLTAIEDDLARIAGSVQFPGSEVDR